MATGEIDEGLAFKHLIEVDINLLLSGYGGLGDAANRLTRLFNEALQAGNCILFIDNFESLLSTEGAGSINAIDVLLPFLESPGIHIIGTTDVASYNQFIRTNTALSERLTRVSVEEANTAETIRILEDTVPMIEHRTGSLISYEAIKETVKVANKYIMDVPNPEKSINVLDGATAHATSERGKTIVLPKDVLSYISIKHDIPATEVEDDEKQKLLHLEEEMHRNVVGQDEAIKAIAGALRRVRAGVTDSKKPIGSFLFLGPTGVGKTETAKSLARAYFGDADRMIRFDMSEYQNKEDIYRLIGSNVGQDVQGLLATAVREKPFSLLLFDEIEKAHPDILDLFLQILDEGHMTDGMGRKVAFSHTIIIATSNAGANLIRESIQGGVEYNKTKLALLDYLQRENIYRPEFINRFTQVVAFAPLSLQEIAQVAALMLAKLQDTVYANRGIKVVVTTEAAAMLAQLGYDPQMGARPMARIIQEKVENFLATKILAGELNKGDSVTISPADLS
ncbi:MAG: ATP-dependent Clp protease ATP-binding subunit ClpC [bacterium ADurb.Bin400]|nr:MAG: ATP-dependent Clp protease ATP-binding subunit ClpC [bacterium ADurb.Bin400]